MSTQQQRNRRRREWLDATPPAPAGAVLDGPYGEAVKRDMQKQAERKTGKQLRKGKRK